MRCSLFVVRSVSVCRRSPPNSASATRTSAKLSPNASASVQSSTIVKSVYRKPRNSSQIQPVRCRKSPTFLGFILPFSFRSILDSTWARHRSTGACSERVAPRLKSDRSQLSEVGHPRSCEENRRRRGLVDSLADVELSKVRREEPGNAVAQLDCEGSSVHVIKREWAPREDPFSRCVQKLLTEFRAIALDIELEVKSQTARIPISRPKERPRLIDNHELGVIKLPRAKPNTAAPLEHLPELSERCPMNVGKVGALGQ